MTIHQTLYARDTSGNVRVWKLESEGPAYRSLSGLIDGKLAESGWTTCSPKNVGKKNETTAEAQCLKEVEAEYTKKAKQGYFEDVADIDNCQTLFPMLAFKYTDLKKGLDWSTGDGFYAQRKFDGIRNLARAQGNFSRTGEPTLTFPAIHEVMQEITSYFPQLSLDGELYNHALADDLPKINSLVRKKNPSEADIAAANKLQYHVYDVFDEQRPDLTYHERLNLLEELFNDFALMDHPSFVFVDTEYVDNQADLDALYTKWRKEGYEGQIIRSPLGMYQPDKRPKDLIKRKEYIDEEFVVADILEGNGNWAGAAKAVVYHHPTRPGDTFETGLKGTYEDNVKVLQEKAKYIGGDGTVAYFKFSPKGVPVQGVTKLLHGGKRAA
ncbi:ATP-dependent DNA ligase [Rhizobium rosettiformans]|uniref:Polydeoxyribonucleotide synthase [ATP] n=2 Tax=Rhizobium rosettiformans TaxID=1368430 RepID=A0A4S8PYR0_9HYPH|nr:hypothetical protein [Rhizobium rosettiformans]MBB5277761.1 ATP-dependent DNA ligase [Rhizobium rosettiformans]THV32924.1 hypothetical protein FAA86_18710 [Rhizobium rosettiformans W3]